MDNMQQPMGGGSKMVCKCVHHKVTPILIILIGLTFLLGALNILSMWAVSIIWPVLLIIAGVKKLAMKSGMCKCC